ncbi:hypothetical protein [Paenibacillus odorifer]|uniref:hypothetical protein n=1 Tax=Paenibacillus odorifer TaxID=189426 RepID=UPI00096DD8FB|nr:hypothetical protein [Paenibacillus odorifer]OMD06109.1 hypothetical protein BJP47_14295 [Paenibacillus odorifer]
MSLLKSIKKNVSVTMCITLLFSLFIVYPASASTFFQDRFEEAVIYGHPLVGIGLLLRTKATAYITSLSQKKDVLLQVIQPGAITLWKRM